MRWGAARRRAGAARRPRRHPCRDHPRLRPSEVWPWIAQMGQGRGGLYSYDALENLVGCDMHSADRVVPEWQDVAVGSELQAAPGRRPGGRGRRAGARARDPRRCADGRQRASYDFAWAFVLEGRARTARRGCSCASATATRAWWSAPAGRAGRGGELRDEPARCCAGSRSGRRGGDPVVLAGAPGRGRSRPQRAAISASTTGSTVSATMGHTSTSRGSRLLVPRRTCLLPIPRPCDDET